MRMKCVCEGEREQEIKSMTRKKGCMTINQNHVVV